MNTAKKEETKGKKITVRFDEKEYERLQEIMKARSLNATDAVKCSVMGIPILYIGNVKELAGEFYKIRVALETNDVTDEVRKEVQVLCQSMSELTAKVEKLEI